MAVLVCLANAGGQVLSREEILDSVWPNMAVTDDVLTQSIVELRKAFGDDARHPTVIETIPKVGFRLLASVAPASGESAPGNVPRKSRRYLLATTALLVAGASVWIFLGQLESARQPIIVLEEPLSIAVLPFVNMSNDPANEFFADGISEDIRILLSRIPDLKVIGRTSTIQFKRMSEDPRVIGQMLGVKIFLEGSVRKSGDQIRITAQLVDVYDGTSIWLDSYDRTMTDIFAVQDDIAAAIIDALQIHVSAIPTRGRLTENLEANILFQRARFAANAFDLLAAEDLLLEAVKLDPNFAEAYEMLAFVYWSLPREISVLETQRRVSDTAKKALALNPDLVLAQAYFQAAKPGPYMRLRAINAFEQAARERPDEPWILEGFTFLLTEYGYLQEALTFAERYVELDPLSESANTHWPLALYAVGRTDEALAALEFMNRSDWDFHMYRWAIEGVNLVENQGETTIAHVEAYLQQNDDPDPTWFREMVTRSRDPATGQSYLDYQIPQIVAARAQVDAADWRRGLTSLYLYFGHLDRYYELALATNPSDTTWDDAGAHLWRSAIFRRHGGSTAHPGYLELAEVMGIFHVWDQRGPPDFCDKVDGEWICE